MPRWTYVKVMYTLCFGRVYIVCAVRLWVMLDLGILEDGWQIWWF